MERALCFIADHLEEPMVVADVARAAGLSEYYLHRVFREAVGETIGRFVMRRRLETAALRLAYQRDRSISDIALSSGSGRARPDPQGDIGTATAASPRAVNR